MRTKELWTVSYKWIVWVLNEYELWVSYMSMRYYKVSDDDKEINKQNKV